MTDNIHAKSFIESFIQRDKRERYISMLKLKHGKADFIGILSSINHLNSTYAFHLPKGNKMKQIGFIKDFLKKEDLLTCYIISQRDDINEKTMNINDALQEVVGSSTGTILSFIPGRIAYYEGESTVSKYLLIR